MATKRFQIRNRTDFDEFWVQGLELWRVVAPKLAEEPITKLQRTVVPFALPEPPIDLQVWWSYATSDADEGVDLLIEPGRHTGTTLAMQHISEHVIDQGDASPENTELAQGFGYVALQLRYQHMVQRLLPLTSWAPLLGAVRGLNRPALRNSMRVFAGLESRGHESDVARSLLLGWFLHLLAVCEPNGRVESPVITYGHNSEAIAEVAQLLRGANTDVPSATTTGRGIGRITLNRAVRSAVHRSVRTVKIDATRELFDVRCDSIRWAIVDSGIDARHTAFRLTGPDGEPFPGAFENDGVAFNYTRVVRSFDFTRQRTSGTVAGREERSSLGLADRELTGDIPIAMDLGERWYEPPEDGHGTHIAGIIGGRDGLCPEIRLLDYRVLDGDGRGNEFVVVSALRHILGEVQRSVDPTGRTRDLAIHGVNLSLSLDVDVTSDACGWSLICRACDDLVRAGVVVVVSAGNTGFEDRAGESVSTGQNYRTVSITDPGNADRVITVGSTDADRPREYGVSFFSARGPTADGRLKPDLVAPGNGIRAAYGYRRGDDDRVDEYATLDGTSQAAAHVSGCAATLMARHGELIGKPDEVKRILVGSATDLGRDRSFQGAGLVDALRAVQEI